MKAFYVSYDMQCAVHAITLKLVSPAYRYEMDHADNVFLRGNAGSRGQTGSQQPILPYASAT